MKDKKSLAAAVIKLLLIGLAVGFVLTLLSLLVPVRVESALDVDDMRFGKPFAFLIQGFSKVVNEEFFPCRVIPKFTDGYSTEVKLLPFCASWAVNWLIGIGLILLKRKLSSLKKKKPKSEIVIK